MNDGFHIRRESICVGIGALLLFTAGLWDQPFIGFEARFALFAQEMLRHGPSLFPTTYGEPYPDYPATSTLFIWICSIPFGAVTKLSAVLPTALASALNLALTYRLVARCSRQWALLTISLEVLTATFLAAARSISLDQMLATIVLLGFYLAYTGVEENRAARLRWLPAVLVAGFLVRGPLGIVLPAAVVGSYYLLAAHWRQLAVFTATATAVLLGCSAAMFLLSSRLYGDAFSADVLRMQVTGRLEGGDTRGPGYYFVSSIGNYALAFPLAAIAAGLLLVDRWHMPGEARDPRARKLLVHLAGWSVVVLIGLSIPHAKKARYLLPIVPAIAALAAYPLTELARGPALRRFGFVLQKLFLAMPLLLGIALCFATLRWRGAPALSTLAAGAGLVALQLSSMVVQWKWRPGARAVGLVGTAALAVWTLNLLVVEPLQVRLHDTRAFVAEVETLRRQRPGELVFFLVGKDAAAIKYMVNVEGDLQPRFLSEDSAIDALPGPAYVVVRDSDLHRLNSSIDMSRLRAVVHGDFDNSGHTVFFIEGTT